MSLSEERISSGGDGALFLEPVPEEGCRADGSREEVVDVMGETARHETECLGGPRVPEALLGGADLGEHRLDGLAYRGELVVAPDVEGHAAFAAGHLVHGDLEGLHARDYRTVEEAPGGREGEDACRGAGSEGDEEGEEAEALEGGKVDDDLGQHRRFVVTALVAVVGRSIAVGEVARPGHAFSIPHGLLDEGGIDVPFFPGPDEGPVGATILEDDVELADHPALAAVEEWAEEEVHEAAVGEARMRVREASLDVRRYLDEVVRADGAEVLIGLDVAGAHGRRERLVVNPALALYLVQEGDEGRIEFREIQAEVDRKGCGHDDAPGIDDIDVVDAEGAGLGLEPLLGPGGQFRAIAIVAREAEEGFPALVQHFGFGRFQHGHGKVEATLDVLEGRVLLLLDARAVEGGREETDADGYDGGCRERDEDDPPVQRCPQHALSSGAETD